MKLIEWPICPNILRILTHPEKSLGTTSSKHLENLAYTEIRQLLTPGKIKHYTGNNVFYLDLL